MRSSKRNATIIHFAMTDKDKKPLKNPIKKVIIQVFYVFPIMFQKIKTSHNSNNKTLVDQSFYIFLFHSFKLLCRPYRLIQFFFCSYSTCFLHLQLSAYSCEHGTLLLLIYKILLCLTGRDYTFIRIRN